MPYNMFIRGLKSSSIQIWLLKEQIQYFTNRIKARLEIYLTSFRKMLLLEE